MFTIIFIENVLSFLRALFKNIMQRAEAQHKKKLSEIKKIANI